MQRLHHHHHQRHQQHQQQHQRFNQSKCLQSQHFVLYVECWPVSQSYRVCFMKVLNPMWFAWGFFNLKCFYSSNGLVGGGSLMTDMRAGCVCDWHEISTTINSLTTLERSNFQGLPTSLFKQLPRPSTLAALVKHLHKACQHAKLRPRTPWTWYRLKNQHISI